MIRAGHLSNRQWELARAAAERLRDPDPAIVAFPPNSSMCTGCSTIRPTRPGYDAWAGHDCRGAGRPE